MNNIMSVFCLLLETRSLLTVMAVPAAVAGVGTGGHYDPNVYYDYDEDVRGGYKR